MERYQEIERILITKYRKNINDMKISFGFVENFMKKVGIYDQYKMNFEK